ncbi:hypothetical protein MVEG_11016 [Podila verticillata NRRL 6337]|uniref:3-oxoacyl-[acyl-carrier protein] reductase n=1 Tax=Podila verticillata NRRL 6337 TaxID=1069443 RepID=A0A086TM01_9FUNG|nr:hypothetical protein MVEG_11016 [Podila verticillata NRRL 6337]
MTSSRRVAIITGASRGIGRGIALRLAKDGFNIVINYNSSIAKAQEVVNEIAALPGTHSDKEVEHVRAIAVQADVGKMEDAQRLLRDTIASFGRIDIVVFNAAWIQFTSIRDLAEQSYLDAFDTNVKGPLFFSKLAQPHLAKAQEEAAVVQFGGSPLGGSRIISISSVAAIRSDIGESMLLYAMTKGALNQLTRVLARDPDFGGKGITVNAVAPGPIDTDALRMLPQWDSHASKNPQKRIGQVDDIADVVSFLASNDSRWVNGHTMVASAGAVV